MAAGLPFMVILLLGSIVITAWMIGRREGRRLRCAIGGFLFAGMVIELLVVGSRGIWDEMGGTAFMLAWLTGIAMFLVPVAESAWRALR